MAMMKMRRQQLQRNPEADVSSKSLLRLGTQQEENHTKTFAQSEALSRGSFLKVMLTGAAGALSAGTGLARSLRFTSCPPVQTSCQWTYAGHPSLWLNCGGDWRQGKIR